MKQYARFLFLILVISSLVAISSCGSDKKSQSSSTSPTIYYSNSAAFMNGATYTWGDNTYGNLGNGDDNANNKKTAPAQVTGSAASGMKGVVVGGTHMLAFDKSGNAYSWGNNAYGQLGNSSESVTATPLQVSSVAGVIAVSAGQNHSLALVGGSSVTNRKVMAWGNNSYYQLATTDISSYTYTPQTVPGTNKATKISAGGAHNLALIDVNGDGSEYKVLAWGYNYYGQLGTGSTASSIATPTYVQKDPANPTDLTNISDIAAGGSHSLFLVNGSVYACGYNHYGQLGYGTQNETNPAVATTPVKGYLEGKTVTQIAAGLDHSLALVNDGTVYAWGYNYYGQLGDWTTTNRTTPVQVLKSDGTPLTNITTIVAIGHHSMAVDSSGQLWIWGDNTYGQLGIGSTTSSSYAVPVSGMVSAVIYHP